MPKCKKGAIELGKNPQNMIDEPIANVNKHGVECNLSQPEAKKSKVTRARKLSGKINNSTAKKGTKQSMKKSKVPQRVTHSNSRIDDPSALENAQQDESDKSDETTYEHISHCKTKKAIERGNNGK